MSETNHEREKFGIMLKQFEETLATIASLQKGAEVQLKAINEARKKADDDASYAHQAKINTEEHSKATALFKGAAEADANAISANKNRLEEITAWANQGRAAFDSELQNAASVKMRLADLASELSHSSSVLGQQIQAIQEHHRVAESRLNEINGWHANVSSVTERVDTLLNQAQEKERAAQTIFAQCSEEVRRSSQDVAVQQDAITHKVVNIKSMEQDVKNIIQRLSSRDTRAQKDEAEMGEFKEKLRHLIVKAEELLPGATTAGLAHSFKEQKDRFSKPQKTWLNTFRLCIALLVVVAAPSFYTAVFYTSNLAAWSDILRGMVVRLPIVIPLVWLAIYSGRNYMLSLRMEEEYAYKEALSRAFEGYKREMGAIDESDSERPTPLNKLCINILAALAERPGRIYEGKTKSFTPANELVDIVDEIAKR